MRKEYFYTLAIIDRTTGATVASRNVRFFFDPVFCDYATEEYGLGQKAKELFREAAFAAGKWPASEEQK